MILNPTAKNLGKGGAVRRGALVSRGDFVLFADADGATKFPDLVKLEAKLKSIRTDDGHGQNRNAKIYWHWSESVIYKR